MTIETKDLVGWGITGSLGLLSLFLNWRTRQDTKRREQKHTEAVWSLRASTAGVAPGDALFVLRLQDPNDQRLRLLRIETIKPRGVQISPIEWKWIDGNAGSLAMPKGYGETIEIDKDLSPDELFIGTGFKLSDSATEKFLARVPKPRNGTAQTSRLEVRLWLESVSARAESKKMIARSEPIDWAKLHDETAQFE